MQNPRTGVRWMVAAITSISITAFAPGHAASVAPVTAENGMVVSAQQLATTVGVDVLKRGGNAVDAAVAVGYALAVVYPAAGNLGGGGFMTIQLADGRKTFLDFRETAPKGATANMYLDKDGNVIKGLSTKGHLAVGVPGSVSGMEYAREKYGTMKRADLIAPALQLAEDGFALDQGDVDMLLTATKDFQEDPASAAIFLNNGKPFQVGEKLVQHELAETLREISKRGTDGFYKGWVGSAIVASSQAGKGLITQEDLDGYKTRELTPVECDYRGYHVVSAVAPGPDQSGELRAVAGHPQDPGGQGPQVRSAATGQPPGGNHHRRAVADEQAGRQQSLLRGERPAPQHRAGCRLLIVIARSNKVASAGASHRDASAADDATSSTQAGCGRPNMPESYSWVPIHAISSS